MGKGLRFTLPRPTPKSEHREPVTGTGINKSEYLSNNTTLVLQVLENSIGVLFLLLWE
jgi:hypothetical protein